MRGHPHLGGCFPRQRDPAGERATTSRPRGKVKIEGKTRHRQGGIWRAREKEDASYGAKITGYFLGIVTEMKAGAEGERKTDIATIRRRAVSTSRLYIQQPDRRAITSEARSIAWLHRTSSQTQFDQSWWESTDSTHRQGEFCVKPCRFLQIPMFPKNNEHTTSGSWGSINQKEVQGCVVQTTTRACRVNGLRTAMTRSRWEPRCAASASHRTRSVGPMFLDSSCEQLTSDETGFPISKGHLVLGPPLNWPTDI
jgi:hypothetical protein